MEIKKLASRPDSFNATEKAPCTHKTGDWLDPKVGLNFVEKRKFSSPYRESNPNSSIIQHLAPTYID
jgi:hypothetical protein